MFFLNIFSTGESEQIFLEIYEAALEADLSTLERSVTMPLFSVKSELNMEKYLKKVPFFNLGGTRWHI